MNFQHYVHRINQQLDLCLPKQGELSESMRYSVLAGGKRFRPMLTYMTTRAFGVNLDRADSSACAVELIHAYSLIHDDLPVMDDDDIRHNQPACHKKFGEARAILAGDGLQALAFEVLAHDARICSQTRIKLLKLLTKTSFAMVEGQSIDLSAVNCRIDIHTLERMHRKKTGALLTCSVLLGALLAEHRLRDFELLQSFAQKIGLAYQIQDDVLDVVNPQALGRQQHSDEVNNKPTYPKLLGLEESTRLAHNLYVEAREKLLSLSAEIATDELQQLTAQLKMRA